MPLSGLATSRRRLCFQPSRTRNSRLVAIVSGDRTKRRAIARRYGLEHAYPYEAFEECLQHVDTVYVALPNSQHAEYTVRAARAGVHVLCEKSMAVTVTLFADRVGPSLLGDDDFTRADEFRRSTGVQEIRSSTGPRLVS